MTETTTISAEVVRALARWERDGRSDAFPFELVMSCYLERGKHFVSESVLAALAAARSRLAVDPGPDPDPGRVVLEKFLTVALDKWDGRYDYLTYLGIDLLGLVPEADGATARRQRDTLLGLLLADVWAFELGARDGVHDRLPLQRPGPELTDRRLRMLATTLAQWVAPEARAAGDPERPFRALLDDASAHARRALSVSMQPVYVAHDEYLFIRVLQSYEVTFAAMAADLRDAVGAVREGRAADAAASVRDCGAGLAEARRLFTLLATMQAESFRVFRAYTVGASAIQSGNYKMFEALCSPPPRSRVVSPAFDAVPHIRERVLGDWIDLTTAVDDAVADGTLDTPGRELICAAAQELEDVHQRWKQTHWKLASRMIGDEVGTGYTVGVPYLKDAIENRLFPRLPGRDRA